MAVVKPFDKMTLENLTPHMYLYYHNTNEEFIKQKSSCVCAVLCVQLCVCVVVCVCVCVCVVVCVHVCVCSCVCAVVCVCSCVCV